MRRVGSGVDHLMRQQKTAPGTPWQQWERLFVPLLLLNHTPVSTVTVPSCKVINITTELGNQGSAQNVVTGN